MDIIIKICENTKTLLFCYNTNMPESIKEIRQKIKHFLRFIEQKDIFTVLVIILVAFASFGLGRISKIEENRTPVKIQEVQQTGQSATAIHAQNSEKKGLPAEVSAQTGLNEPFLQQNYKMYVASKNGSKYHFPWCSGAKRIKEANKIWFATIDEARKAGYTPAGNCKGLE